MFEVPYAPDSAGRLEGRVAAVLLEGLVEEVLRAELASGAPELQENAQHAALAGMGQRVRQALEEGLGA